jgi:hypothetical protein
MVGAHGIALPRISFLSAVPMGRGFGRKKAAHVFFLHIPSAWEWRGFGRILFRSVMSVRIAPLACASPHNISLAYQRLECRLGGGPFYALLLELVEQVTRGEGMLHLYGQNF